MTELNHLDEDQLKAVKYLDNALVIAGAGSGKTTTIIAKIEYLIEMKIYKPDEILIISFTNETVNNLKTRIKYKVDINTFHKLALNIIDDANIKNSPDDHLNYIINEYFNSYVLSNKKAKSRIKRILKTTNQKNFESLIKTFIMLYKSNYSDLDFLFRLYRKSFFLNKDYLLTILEIYSLYQTELEASGMVDFNDMISYATELIQKNKRRTKYKYILVDEFQDTSETRFRLIEAIMKQNSSKLFLVGDDYQSIYRFSGCDLNIFINIEKYIPGIKKLHINHNYRNNQNLINIANKFILKNKLHIKKNTICHKDIDKPIVIYFYTKKDNLINNVTENIVGNILVLGRNNYDKQDFNIIENEKLRFLTIHKAKGLEEENIILINLYNKRLGFPSQIKNEALINTILQKDYYPFEEERRLMYVALTRTKTKIHILVPADNYSIFIKELIKENRKYIEIRKI